jgi:hypothetical protein
MSTYTYVYVHWRSKSGLPRSAIHSLPVCTKLHFPCTKIGGLMSGFQKYFSQKIYQIHNRYFDKNLNNLCTYKK